MGRSRHGSEAAPLAFTISGNDGVYATEVVYLSPSRDEPSQLDIVDELQLMIDTLAAGATVEVDILKAGGDSTEPNDWSIAVASYATVGLQEPLALSSWQGVRIRAQSSTTAGVADGSVCWW